MSQSFVLSADGQPLLSPSEFLVMRELCAGLKPREICARFGLADRSINTLTWRAVKKLSCRTRLQAAVKFKTFYEPRYAFRYTHVPVHKD